MLRVGADVGKTHTDFVLIDEARVEVHVHKVPTTVGDPSLGAINGLNEMCRKANVSAAEIDYFVHGTTIATNIILEHNSAKCGLITTEGCADILHIARHERPHKFSPQFDLPWRATAGNSAHAMSVSYSGFIRERGQYLSRSTKAPTARVSPRMGWTPWTT